MQGRRIFTSEEASKLRELLKEKRWADRDAQKRCRANLRRLKFYITDFSTSSDGFDHLSFDKLIASGRISIRDNEGAQSNISTPTPDAPTKQNVVSDLPTEPAKDITWEYCHAHSDKILSSGLATLTETKSIDYNEVEDTAAGVYLISLDAIPVYIGEGKNLKVRLKQQYTPQTSTFYKNYVQSIPGKAPRPITDFKLQMLRIDIGRKELEEFGIVNIPTTLNKFQRNKRAAVGSLHTGTTLWRAVQKTANNTLSQGETILRGRSRIGWPLSNPQIGPGIYVVYGPDGALLYIGESSDIRERHIAHSGRTYFSALRKNLGRSVMGFTYVPEKKRQFLPKQDEQVTAFINACHVSTLPIAFGRLELEEYMIQLLQPPLNRKSK